MTKNAPGIKTVVNTERKLALSGSAIDDFDQGVRAVLEADDIQQPGRFVDGEILEPIPLRARHQRCTGWVGGGFCEIDAHDTDGRAPNVEASGAGFFDEDRARAATGRGVRKDSNVHEAQGGRVERSNGRDATCVDALSAGIDHQVAEYVALVVDGGQDSERVAVADFDARRVEREESPLVEGDVVPGCRFSPLMDIGTATTAGVNAGVVRSTQSIGADDDCLIR